MWSCSLLDPGANSNSPQTSPSLIITESIDFKIQKSSTQSDWLYCKIQDVDLSQYSNLDSIIFTPNMRSQHDDEYCIVELF